MYQTLALEDIYRPIQQDLDVFRARLKSRLINGDAFLNQLGSHVLGMSGKQLRPALTLLAARVGAGGQGAPIDLAMAVELLHTATLVHDDIVDGSLTRRNQASMNARWGNEISIICGDYIYAKAFSVIADLGHPDITSLFADCVSKICEGEMKQIESRRSGPLDETVYLNMVEKKTAALFQAAALAGGLYSKASLSDLAALSEYGLCLGMAFQIVDDCLDIIGKEEVLGKKAGSDWEKSDPTLPVIYLCLADRNGAPLEFREWRERMNDLGSFENIRARVMESGAIDRSEEIARRFAARAEQALQSLKSGESRKSLSDLAAYTLQRLHTAQ